MRRRSFLKVTSSVLAAAFLMRTSKVGATERYTTRGVLKSFGRARAYVNITHEDIPGYMLAMTMSFEPASATQLDGLAEGDRVSFTFTDDGQHRRLEQITKA